MKNFKKILFLLTPYERKRAVILLVMTLIMALLDMIGVASILPFIAVLTNPELIETNLILNNIYQYLNKFGIVNNQQFLFVIGAIVFVTLISSITFKAITTYVQVRFIFILEYTISKRLLEGYLHQPYSWFLSRNSAEIGKTILAEVSQVIGGGIKPLIDLIAQSMVAIALIILVMVSDLKLALIVGFSLGSAYGIFFYFIRRYLNRIGKERLNNNELRFSAVIEAFGASKEIKVGGLEKTYIKKFSDSAKATSQASASSQFINQMPRFFLEALAFGGILLIILYKMTQAGSFIDSLPIVSLYVFAGYRLMPAIQQIYVSFAKLSFVGPSLDKLYNNFKNLKSFDKNYDQNVLSLNKTIALKNVYYSYPNSSRTALKYISLHIPIKKNVGLVGATGSGKTTTVDIILGLLEVQKGSLEVDGKIITKQNLRSWQRSIGYVPQHIYLSDDSITANIAFGLEPKDINQVAVEKASKIANLHEFVINELPKQYQTIIGERGVRLSGGQRQRIGIARALYRNPQVLILDEATSALDNQTEKAVMDAVNNLSKDITIIIIAHRLNTVKDCDIIFKFDKGHIVDQGNFNELFK